MRNDKANKDLTEARLEDIKNDLHMFRYETHNNILNSKTSIFKSLSGIEKSISVVGKPVIAKYRQDGILKKFEDYSTSENYLKNTSEDMKEN